KLEAKPTNFAHSTLNFAIVQQTLPNFAKSDKLHKQVHFIGCLPFVSIPLFLLIRCKGIRYFTLPKDVLLRRLTHDLSGKMHQLQQQRRNYHLYPDALSDDKSEQIPSKAPARASV
ncbi:MAG: hypothetical protein LKI59_08170, partial [Bacteroidales bacterium]|nr:hypothetical protein [Bacteroidales bacterium]